MDHHCLDREFNALLKAIHDPAETSADNLRILKKFYNVYHLRKTASRRSLPRPSNGGTISRSRARQLPHDIWIIICSYVDFASSKQLRLVNKALSKWAAKKLFEVVYVTALPDSFLRLRNIAQHGFFPTEVRKLVYLVDRLNENVADIYEWINIAAHVSTDQLSEDSKAKQRRYVELCCQQMTLLKDKAEASALAQCIPLLPNLEDVDTVTATDLRIILEGGPHPIVGRLFRETLVDPDIMFMDRDPFFRQHACPYVALIRAFDESKRSMTRLNIELPWSFWACRNRSTTPLLCNIRTCLVTAFATLRELKLSGGMGKMGKTADGTISPISLFIEFLSAAPQLEELDLNFHPISDYYDNEGTDLTEAFTRLTCSKLRTFSASLCCATRESLVGFLERHATSLRHLHLHLVDLAEPGQNPARLRHNYHSSTSQHPDVSAGAWATAIKHLAPIMDLCMVSLRGLNDISLMNMRHKNRNEDRDIKEIWCDELALYLEWGGRGPRFPTYGEPLPDFCGGCGSYHDESDDDSNSLSDIQSVANSDAESDL